MAAQRKSDRRCDDLLPNNRFRAVLDIAKTTAFSSEATKAEPPTAFFGRRFDVDSICAVLSGLFSHSFYRFGFGFVFSGRRSDDSDYPVRSLRRRIQELHLPPRYSRSGGTLWYPDSRPATRRDKCKHHDKCKDFGH